MKRTILLSFLLMFCVTWSFAENKNDLKGPAAKNYKVWMHKAPTKTYLTTVRKVRQGPVVKNQKVWKNENTQTVAINMTANSSKPQGPAAKNKKN